MKHLELGARARAFQARPWLGLLFGLVLATLLAAVSMQSARAADASDPPERAGRLAEVNGQVWIYATDSGEWVAAQRNRPITTGDRLSTENDGRAEVRVGSSVLRIAGNTEIEVLQLDDDHVSVQLHSGSATARLRTREAANEFGLATEEGRFRTERPGSYRFDRIDDTSSATALSGQAVYEGDGTALTVQQGQRVEFWKERGAAQYSITEPKRDSFGDWVASRDSREERSVSTRYVSPEMTGAEDLDRYGSWEQTPDYGAVWIPREVAPGWAPYRMGHWAWVSPWGWSWVDDAPWGFAPFHYGRWVWLRNSWCWTPGRYVARPVYAPALVAWVGGSNLSVSITAGRAPTVGWFPLAPREVYVPGYRVSPRYVRNVNVTQVTNITNINVTNIVNNPGRAMADTPYVNRRLPHAVTVVPASVVERRQPVAPAITTVNDRVLRDMVRERPRADAPVAAPPRFAPGTRPVGDPRMSRPGSPSNSAGFAPGAPGQQAQQPGGPRVNGERPGDRVGDRGDRPGDRAGDRAGERPGDRAGDRPGDRVGERPGDRAGATPPGAVRTLPAPATGVAAQPQQPGATPPRAGGNNGGERPNERPGDNNRPTPPVANTAPEPAAPVQRPQDTRERERDRPGRGGPTAVVPTAPVNPGAPVANAPPPQRGGFVRNQPPPAPDRAMAPQREERVRRNPEMPGPPRAAVQAPPAAQPHPQAPPPQVARPAPAPHVPAPAPAARPPEVQRPPPQAAREARPQQPEGRPGQREGRGGDRER